MTLLQSILTASVFVFVFVFVCFYRMPYLPASMAMEGASLCWRSNRCNNSESVIILSICDERSKRFVGSGYPLPFLELNRSRGGGANTGNNFNGESGSSFPGYWI